MITLSTHRVWKEITIAAAKCRNPAHVAVAYFGAKGDKLLPIPKGSSLVVDATLPTVATGSTCPASLQRLGKAGVDIYSAQYLHAKVYAFDGVAFIGSANASNRSEDMLIEAILRVDNETAISSARAFVKSICLTRLSAADLSELAQHYRPPQYSTPVPSPTQIKFSTLVMELTNEQGEGRMTQVQPPKAVWEHYFGIKVGREKLPTFTLLNESADPMIETRRDVVKHHHNYTIEIAGAESPRPAILKMRRVARNIYSYSVHRPMHDTFVILQSLLETMPNPLRNSGRLWILI